MYSYLYPYQEFQDYKDADDAVYEMNHKELMGERYAYQSARFMHFRFG